MPYLSNNKPSTSMICFFIITITVSATASTPLRHDNDQPLPSPYFCGQIKIQPPLTSSRMMRCKSHRLYFRTSLGLFPVSSIDYATGVLTLADPAPPSSLLPPPSSIRRVAFEISADHHLPDVCKECEKPNGSCGAGVRCICHPKQCKDKVISRGRSMNAVGDNKILSWVYIYIILTVLITWWW